MAHSGVASKGCSSCFYIMLSLHFSSTPSSLPVLSLIQEYTLAHTIFALPAAILVHANGRACIPMPVLSLFLPILAVACLHVVPRRAAGMWCASPAHPCARRHALSLCVPLRLCLAARCLLASDAQSVQGKTRLCRGGDAVKDTTAKKKEYFSGAKRKKRAAPWHLSAQGVRARDCTAALHADQDWRGR